MNATLTPHRYLTTREAARVLGIHPQKLVRHFLAGDLPEPPRLGTQRVFTADAVEIIKRTLDKEQS